MTGKEEAKMDRIEEVMEIANEFGLSLLNNHLYRMLRARGKDPEILKQFRGEDIENISIEKKQLLGSILTEEAKEKILDYRSISHYLSSIMFKLEYYQTLVYNNLLTISYILLSEEGSKRNKDSVEYLKTEVIQSKPTIEFNYMTYLAVKTAVTTIEKRLGIDILEDGS